MHWKGFAGRTRVKSRAVGWEGAIQLQWRQFVHVKWWLGLYLARKRFLHMPPWRWWAEWGTARTCWRREGGMTVRALLSITPFTVYRWSRNWCYSRSAGGSSWPNSGKPDSMMDVSCTMLVSLAVATLMSLQVMARVSRDEDTNDASSSSMIV